MKLKDNRFGTLEEIQGNHKWCLDYPTSREYGVVHILVEMDFQA